MPRLTTPALPLAGALVLAACGAGATPPRTTPAPAPTLPPIPLIEGTLAPRVQYPGAGALVTARDSTFIFGSLGTGRATLAINGAPVTVHPNGSWIAFLPVPGNGRYELVAAVGADTVRRTHQVRTLAPRPALAADGPLVVDSASVAPRGEMALRDDEPVRVSVRAPANAAAWVELPARAGAAARRPLVSAAVAGGDSLLRATDVPAALLREGGSLVVARGADTARFRLPAVRAAVDSLPRWAVLGVPDAAADTDRVVIARPTPGGTYKWFLLPGTQLEVTGRVGDFARVRLDDALEAWVGAGDVRALPAGAASPRRTASNARLEPAEGWVDLVVPVGERPAYLVEQGPRRIELTLYGTRADTDILQYTANDSLVRLVTWEPVASDRVRYTLHLSRDPFGHLVLWRDGALVLRVRRPPVVAADAPLRGLTIAVDPGHPGAPGESSGATGPTGLREPDAVLAVGLRVRDLLRERGATVVMTRSAAVPVPLGQRPIIARRAGAHALVSIHLDAFPDGVNPFARNGTGTYFFHPQAAPLARAVQGEMVARMGLRDRGIYYDNLALPRTRWMPSILTEGAFLMIPEQEAALRTAAFQDAYARGIVAGLERYFRSLATAP
jgi:N-acetylmuramoyl-L-alanine amidase